tara:strand:+ start:192 stop:1163 length:972 start_codon:yes stop_codon:yes gene_type:complete
MTNAAESIKENNTYYFVNKQFEDEFEQYITSLKESFISFQERLQNEFKKEVFEEFLKEDHGLKILLTCTGFSQEGLLRLITLTRVCNDSALNELLLKAEWCDDSQNNFKEWSSKKIESLVKSNKYFRKFIINVFFDAAKIPFIATTLKPFEVKKLDIRKLKDILTMSEETIDTLIRYREKGSYTGRKENNGETAIENVLEDLGISWERGDLPKLAKNDPDKKRTMDFVIPNKKNPLLIIESSYVTTTASGMGDKAKTEIAVRQLIKKYYPSAKFVGFVDGIGWFVRDKDRERIISAFDDVFTFNELDMVKFKNLLKKYFSIND